MFGETTISYIKIWNHPIETTIYKQMLQVPGRCLKTKHLRSMVGSNLKPSAILGVGFPLYKPYIQLICEDEPSILGTNEIFGALNGEGTYIYIHIYIYK